MTQTVAAAGNIILEALLVVALPSGSLCANQVSPRGLVLARNYFPAKARPAVPGATGAVSPAPAPMHAWPSSTDRCWGRN